MNQKKDSPFGKGKNWNLNACVGTNGGPYNYADYGSGYFQVGNLFAKQLIDAGGYPNGVPIDVGIYPLLYLYRQGTELMMKHFIFDKANPPKNSKEHDLKKLWAHSKKEILNLFTSMYGEEELKEPIAKIENFIEKMYELDPRGEVMRFPEDPSGSPFLQDYSIINIEPIYDAAKKVQGIFESFIAAKNEMSEYADEIDI